jgi:hypothetical protein
VCCLVASCHLRYECIPQEYSVVASLVVMGISDVDMTDGIPCWILFVEVDVTEASQFSVLSGWAKHNNHFY